MSDSVQPQRRQPTMFPRPWDSPGKNTGVGCHFLLQRMKVESEVAQSCPTLSSPMDCSLPGSSIHGIWLPNAKCWLTGKDPDAGKDWRQKEKWAAENEMVRQHLQLNGHESEQTLGDSEGQGSLAGCSLWGRRVGHDSATEQQHKNSSKLIRKEIFYLHLFKLK